MRTKYFYQKLEERENADQAIISLKSWQNGKILKGQQEILTEFKTFYEQLYGQKNSVQSYPFVIGRNDQNQWNQQFNFNLKYVSLKIKNGVFSRNTKTRKTKNVVYPDFKC